MTIQDLIDAMRGYPPDTEVYISQDDGRGHEVLMRIGGYGHHRSKNIEWGTLANTGMPCRHPTH